MTQSDSGFQSYWQHQDFALLVPDVLFFKDDGMTPNSPFPVLVYHLSMRDGIDAAAAFEALFAHNRWTPLWRDGVFDYHHYHSTAHEVLGVASGDALLRLGGEQGDDLTVKRGDVLVLPAGTGHRRWRQSEDFVVVGAYPEGQEDYDIQRPETADHAAALRRIGHVGVPGRDPVAGEAGVLVQTWISE